MSSPRLSSSRKTLRANRFTFALCALFTAACSSGGGGGLDILPPAPGSTTPDCADDDSCEPRVTDGGEEQGPAGIRGLLAERNDALAEWLLSSEMTDDGILVTDFNTVLAEVGSRTGCAPESTRTFVLSDDLVVGRPFPRAIGTLCSDQPVRATEFFVAASFPDPANPKDLDERNLEMFIWDRVERRYVFYAMLPVEGSDTAIQLEVEPRRCAQCHLNADSLDSDSMPMLPIMNELTSPWPHWNARPDFPSHSFTVHSDTETAPNYSDLTAGDRLASAAGFEAIVRTAQENRVAGTRAKLRNAKADLDQAMALLRPLYCSEQVNYVTEDHQSGLLPTAAIIDDGLRGAFASIRVDWPWAWFHDQQIRFGSDDEPPLAMIPVRGHADVSFEQRLLGVRTLTAEQVLQIRAIDWQNPLLSARRCDLWKRARARLRTGQDKLPIEDGQRNRDVVDRLFKIIMHDGERPLVTDDANTVLVIDNEGDVGEELTVEAFGARVQEWASTFEDKGGRATLRGMRDSRLCTVREEFPNHPALPIVSCGGLRAFSAAAAVAPEAALDLDGATAQVSQKPGAPIPDGDEDGVALEAEVAFASGERVPALSVEVRLDIAHGWRGDLNVTLTDPAGTVFPVASFAPSDSADDIDTVVPIFVNPDEELRAGTWTLRVTDRSGGNTGRVEGWSLGINQPAPTLLAPGARPKPAR